MDRVVVNIENYGNTSAASVPISLDQTVRSGRLKPGDRFGMVAFGGGVTWGAAISDWDPALAEPLRSEGDLETKELPVLSAFRKAT